MAPDPESRCKLRTCVWIPGSRFARPGMTRNLLRRGPPLALRQPIAEVRQDLLGDRRHVGAGHGVIHGAELGLGQRRVEAGKVLILGELLAHRVRTADDDDAVANKVVERLWLADGPGGTDALHRLDVAVAR